jgi:hypothetical protein
MIREQIIEIRQKAIDKQRYWVYPNEHHIEATGAIMACDEILAILVLQPEHVNINEECQQCGNKSSKELHCTECGNNFPI